MRRRVAGLILATACWAYSSAAMAHAAPLLAQEWRDLGPKERYDAMQNYWRHERRPEKQQRDIEQRYERWRTLPPEERNRLRQNYERLQQLPPQERERFHRKYEKWKQQATPPE